MRKELNESIEIINSKDDGRLEVVESLENNKFFETYRNLRKEYSTPKEKVEFFDNINENLEEFIDYSTHNKERIVKLNTNLVKIKKEYIDSVKDVKDLENELFAVESKIIDKKKILDKELRKEFDRRFKKWAWLNFKNREEGKYKEPNWKDDRYVNITSYNKLINFFEEEFNEINETERTVEINIKTNLGKIKDAPKSEAKNLKKENKIQLKESKQTVEELQLEIAKLFSSERFMDLYIKNLDKVFVRDSEQQSLIEKRDKLKMNIEIIKSTIEELEVRYAKDTRKLKLITADLDRIYDISLAKVKRVWIKEVKRNSFRIKDQATEAIDKEIEKLTKKYE